MGSGKPCLADCLFECVVAVIAGVFLVELRVGGPCFALVVEALADNPARRRFVAVALDGGFGSLRMDSSHD